MADVEITESVDEPGVDSRLGSADFKKAVAAFITGNQPEDILTALGVMGSSQTMSLHSGNPGDGTSNEIDGGGYERAPIAWGEVTGGEGGLPCVVNSAPAVFQVQAGTTVTHYGIWLGETFLYGKALSVPVELDEDGSIAVTATHTYGLSA